MTSDDDTARDRLARFITGFGMPDAEPAEPIGNAVIDTHATIGTPSDCVSIFAETDDSVPIEDWLGGDGYTAYADELHVETPKGAYTFRAEDDTLVIEHEPEGGE